MERGSVARYGVREVQPASVKLSSQVRLIRAMMRLCVSVVGQSHFGRVSQIVGTSISVGIRIFSIVED